MSKNGYIMQLQPFSVNDGDGIRTTIFMAGCPLRCRWCSNPEGFTAQEKVGWYQRKCIGCGACAEVCPQGIGINMNACISSPELSDGEGAHTMTLERDRCITCGACTEACPVDARAKMVTLTDADDILKQIQKHRLFYSYSGGGVTFSGGEATSQPGLLDYLSREIYDMGYSMDIETCGLFDFDRLAPVLARMDLIFMDLKMMDPEKHLKYTGASNERILKNIANLAKLSGADRMQPDLCDPEHRIGNDGKGPQVVIRIPVIGGVNNDAENIRASAAYVNKHLPQARMELLPYHRYGMIKYEALGIPYKHPEYHTPDRAEMEQLREIVRSEGVDIADFR